MPFWRRGGSPEPALAGAGSGALVPAGSGAADRTGGGGGGGWWRGPQQPQQQQPPSGQRRGQQQQPQPAAPRRREPKTLLDSGGVSLLYHGFFPDYIKLIKQVHVRPFMFTATGALSPWTRKAYANVSLRETLFNGSFTAHLKRKSVEYRNALPLPVAGLGGNVVLSAEWRLGRSLLKPRLMVALGTDAGAAVVRPGALFWRKAFFPSKRSRHLGVETAAEMSVSMAHSFTAFDDADDDDRGGDGYDGGGHGGGGGGALGGFRLGIDVRELNLVCRV